MSRGRISVDLRDLVRVLGVELAAVAVAVVAGAVERSLK